MQDSKIVPFDVIFTYPFFWKSSKICSFITTALPTAKNLPENLDIPHSCLLSDLQPSTVWPGNRNWMDVLDKIKCDNVEYIPDVMKKGKKNSVASKVDPLAAKTVTTHYEILCARYVKRKLVEIDAGNSSKEYTYEKHPCNLSYEELSSVGSLLKLIRDKHQHADDVPTDRKKALGWFTEEGNLDEHRFAQYWTKHFPRLLPFLWLKFHQIKEKHPTLMKYYPKIVSEILAKWRYGNLPVDLDGTMKLFSDAVRDDMKHGGIEMRYSNKYPDTLTLEFRYLPVDLITGILDGSTTANIDIREKFVSCHWHKSGDRQYTDIKITKFETSKESQSESCTILIGKTMGDVKTFVGIKNVELASGKIIVFTENPNDFETGTKTKIEMDKVAQIIFKEDNTSGLENPLKWNEYMDQCWPGILVPQEIISKLVINLQGHLVHWTKILPNEEILANWLTGLEGNILKKLLRNYTIHMFNNQNFEPSKNDLYLQRHLTKRVEVKVRDIEASEETEVFVVMNIEMDELAECMAPTTVISEIHHDQLGSFKITNFCLDSKIFLLPFETSNYDKVLTAFKGNAGYSRYNIHLLRHLYGDSFEFLHTHGHPLNQVSCSEITNQSEDSFLMSIETGQCQNEKLILISDKPGMGKSSTLQTLGRKLVKQNISGRLKVVIQIDVIQLMECIRDYSEYPGVVEDVNIIEAIKDAVCKHNFERILLINLLANHSAVVRVEILLDGLDEIPNELRSLAFQSLSIIHNEMPSVRIWATARDHLLHDIRNRFGGLGYRLEPFTRKQQTDFLEEYWLKYWHNHNNTSDNNNPPSSENLQILANQCIGIPISLNEPRIGGSPLQCRFIGEIQADQVIRGNFALTCTPSFLLLDLYDQLIKKMYQVYLRNKCKEELNMEGANAKKLFLDLDMSHTFFAINLLFSEDVANELVSSHLLVLSECGEELNFTMKRIGLVQNTKPVRFMHRSIAEHLTALFLFKMMTKILKGGESDGFQNFLWSHVFEVITDRRGNYCFKFPNLYHFLNSMSKEREHITLTGFGEQARRKQYSRQVRGTRICRAQLQAATTEPYILTFFQAAKMQLHNRTLSLLFSSTPGERLKPFFLDALTYKLFHFCRFLIENHAYFAPENWSALTVDNENQHGILHLVMLNIRRYFWKSSDDVVDNFKATDIEIFINFVVEKDRSVLDQKDSKGQTPLFQLMTGLLVDGSNDFTYIQFATDLINLLVGKLHANVNAVDSRKNSVLHNIIKSQREMSYRHSQWKSKYFYRHMFALLHELGFNFDMKDENGNTALHCAIDSNVSLFVVKGLIVNGADSSVKNTSGQCALHLAMRYGDVELVLFLVQRDPFSVISIDNEGKRAINYECSDELKAILRVKIDELCLILVLVFLLA